MRNMELKERTSFSFFTLYEDTSQVGIWRELGDGPLGNPEYKRLEDEWSKAWKANVDDLGWVWTLDENKKAGEEESMLWQKYGPEIPPEGTADMSIFKRWLDYMEDPRWAKLYQPNIDFKVGVFRSFCHVSKGTVPFFPHLPYETEPYKYYLNSYAREPWTKKESKQFSEMTNFLKKNTVFELADVLEPARLGINPLDDLNIGKDKPYFIGKREDGRGSFFFYKGGVFIADEASDVATYVDAVDEPDVFGPADENKREPISDELEERIYRKCNNVCQANHRLDSSIERGEICGSNLDLHLDHIRPVSKGGKSRFRNLQLLCMKHNLKKQNKLR